MGTPKPKSLVLPVLLSLYLGGCGESINPSNADPFQIDTAASVTDVSSASEEASRRIGEPRNPQSADGSAINTAKSAIIFIGDGMGVSTVTAARIYAGQKAGVDGESFELSWEDFSEAALVKTYNFDAQVPDSAGTATAILSGYRARIGQINHPPKVAVRGPAGNCDRDALPPTLLGRAKDKGLKVGVISTARITHATPAALYAHSFSRQWESPEDVPEMARAAGCTSIAEQMAESPLDLIMGGGAREFESVATPRYAAIGELEDITLPALRLYTESHMSYEADRGEDEPSLAQMTTAAIKALEGELGYILLVEAGRIDHAHHGTNAYRALEDTAALHEAVSAAKAMVGDDTLMLVTADHSHVFTISGYPARNNPILGLVHGFDNDTRERLEEPELAGDGKPFTTLSYANGPVQRDGADYTDVEGADFRQPALVPQDSESHAGEDVPLYAAGAGSQYFGGVMDQPEVGLAIQEALGLR